MAAFFFVIYAEMEDNTDMNRISVLAADIDNTIRPLGQSLSPATVKAFQALHAKGVKLGIASGRPLWQGIEQSAEQWHLGFSFDFLIGLNGSVLKDMHTGRQEEFSFLSPDDIKAIVTAMLAHDPSCNPFIYGDGYELAARKNDLMMISARRNHTPLIEASPLAALWAAPTAKILFRYETEEQCTEAETFARTMTTERFTCFRTTPTMLEFQSPAINKGIALAKYCEHQQIPMEDVWAFGDAENDLEMLMKAGHGICMKNGLDDVKAAADEITAYTCAEDGFSRYVFAHLV